MSALDLEEQEQLASLKAWWNQYGNMVTLAATLALLAVAAWYGWNGYRQSRSQEAAALYETLQKASRANDVKAARDAAGTILEKYSSTVYGPLAALVSAKLHFQSGDLKTAKAQLAWVTENSSNEELKSVARLRLANVQLDESTPDEALKTLSAKPGAGFEALFEATRADGSWAYDDVILVGHSLGSVIAYDILNAAISWDRDQQGGRVRVVERMRRLITVGSPLEKTAYLFRTQLGREQSLRESIAALKQPLILDYARFRPDVFRWVNIYSPADVISGSLTYYDTPVPVETPAAPVPGVRNPVQNIVDRRAWIPFVAHIQYWRNATLRQQLLDAVWGADGGHIYFNSGRVEWFTDTSNTDNQFTSLPREGIAVASVDYRLAHEATYPAQLEDLIAAQQFLVARADELAASLADKPALSLRVTKQQVNAVMEEMGSTARNTIDGDVLAAAMADPESRAASRTYLERRGRK